jgi:two-component system, cell cycle response regulator
MLTSGFVADKNHGGFMDLDRQLAAVAEHVALADKPMKVLAAEDNPVSLTALRAMLTKWGYHAITAADGQEAWRILQEPDGPSLAILDWMMPGLDGVEICRRVRKADREPYIYILLLTSRTESQDLVEGMEAGADDYLTKPCNARELRVRLRAGRRVLDLQRELVAAREALRDQAMHDGLTGLLNRSAIFEALNAELIRSAREKQPLAVMLIDLDRFKQTNDTYGHLAGDEVLCEAARRMKASVRRYDSVGRYGGEEFLIVLPGCDSSSAVAQAERVREAIAAEPCPFGTNSLTVTCSIGVVSRSYPAAEQAGRLVREADEALYRAKNEGRNRVTLAALSA